MSKVATIILIVAAGIGLLLWWAYEDDKNQRMRRDAAAEQRSKEHKEYSDACVRSLENRGARVLDWSRTHGPWETSSGYRFSGRADLGGRYISVECYFDKSGSLIDLAVSPATRY